MNPERPSVLPSFRSRKTKMRKKTSSMHVLPISRKYRINLSVHSARPESIPPFSPRPSLRTFCAAKTPPSRQKKKKRASTNTSAPAPTSRCISAKHADHMKNDGRSMARPLRKESGTTQAFPSITRNAVKNLTPKTSQWCITCRTKTNDA